MNELELRISNKKNEELNFIIVYKTSNMQIV